MPTGNGFLAKQDFADEYFFNLSFGVCDRCGMAQLLELVERDRLFGGQYPFYSSTSRHMDRHFKALAAWVGARLAGETPFVVEVGSNDGVLLGHFAGGGTRVLGVEPSSNVAAAALERGIPTRVCFFDAVAGREIAADHGRADAIVGTNAFSHIPSLYSVFDGCEALLTPGGILVLEEPYLAEILRQTAYDQIYDEHAFYLTAGSTSRLAETHGFELIDVEPQPVHGGSLRYVLSRKGVHRVSDRVRSVLQSELTNRLFDLKTYEDFRAAVERSRDQLRAVLDAKRREGRRIAGYAATSKSTTVLNYCRLGRESIEYISDSTPIKQGLYTPGTHIPVCAPEAFASDAVDCAVLFGWNHAAEILAKEAAFTARGGEWITYVPRVEVTSGKQAGRHTAATSRECP
jgi:methylation protein EvaC